MLDHLRQDLDRHSFLHDEDFAADSQEFVELVESQFAKGFFMQDKRHYIFTIWSKVN